MYQTNVIEICTTFNHKYIVYYFLHYYMVVSSKTQINSLHSQRKFFICCVSHMSQCNYYVTIQSFSEVFSSPITKIKATLILQKIFVSVIQYPYPIRASYSKNTNFYSIFKYNVIRLSFTK